MPTHRSPNTNENKPQLPKTKGPEDLVKRKHQENPQTIGLENKNAARCGAAL
jgi:hypothetical protein